MLIDSAAINLDSVRSFLNADRWHSFPDLLLAQVRLLGPLPKHRACGVEIHFRTHHTTCFAVGMMGGADTTPSHSNRLTLCSQCPERQRLRHDRSPGCWVRGERLV